MFKDQLAIASPSLGQHTTHTLPEKITAAAQHGFAGIEITYSDLQAFAATSQLNLLQAALKAKQQCGDQGLYILAFAAFENFEGHPSPLDHRLETAKHWLEIAHALGTEHLQVPSSYDRSIDTNMKVIVSELRQLAELAASYEPVIKVAYENLAWSKHCTLWQEALSIVERVDRANFGLCMDSFHIAVAVWGDTYHALGIQRNAEWNLAASLKELVRDCPVDKIFYLQLSDGERLDPPYSTSHPWYNAALEAGHVWSNEARPFPLETQYGAYMPVEDIAKAFLVDTRFQGWVSLETFDRRMRERAYGPAHSARRGWDSWAALSRRLMAGGPKL